MKLRVGVDKAIDRYQEALENYRAAKKLHERYEREAKKLGHVVATYKRDMLEEIELAARRRDK